MTAKRNHIAIVLDRSDSMYSLSRAAVNAVNANLATIKSQAKQTDQPTTVTIITFASDVTTERLAVDSDDIVPLNQREYRCGGMTALFDAVARGVETLENFEKTKEDSSFVIIAITDGGENASREYTMHNKRLASLIRTKELTDRWTFAFLVPHGGERTLVSMGVAEGNITSWDQTTSGVQEYAARTSDALKHYFTGREKGQRSTKSFFTDLKDLTKEEVKATLNDISKHVNVLNVKSEVAIKEFVEGHYPNTDFNHAFKGKCYYQLTKSEEVQGYKKVLIKQKNGNKIYGGTMDQMRAIIGLDGTSGKSARVRPGNHGDWEVFIQSTSVNRKLVRGTDLLVLNLE